MRPITIFLYRIVAKASGSDGSQALRPHARSRRTGAIAIFSEAAGVADCGRVACPFAIESVGKEGPLAVSRCSNRCIRTASAM